MVFEIAVKSNTFSVSYSKRDSDSPFPKLFNRQIHCVYPLKTGFNPQLFPGR